MVQKSRCVEVRDAFGLDRLTLGERADVVPGPGEVKVRVRAASLNYRDLMMIRGQYNPRQPLPLIPCSDGAGEIEAVGAGVREWKVGDRVTTTFAPDWLAGEPTRARLATTLGGPRDGALQETLILPAHGVMATPEHLSDEEASTLPCAALTAWNALMTHGHLKAGDSVLVQGSGGVSIFALQFAKLCGARVIAISSSDEKLARMQAMGAEVGINYRTHPKWGKKVLEALGNGVDQVVEVGGAGTFEQSLIAVRMGGIVSIIGVLSGSSAPLSVTPILMKQVRCQGVLVGHRESFEAMNRAIRLSELRPVVDACFSLDEFDSAFAHMEAGKHFGKIVITL